MPIPISTAVLQDYEEKRRQAQSDAAFRKSEVYARYPRLSEIDQALEETGFRAIRSYLTLSQASGGEPVDKASLLSSLKSDNQTLREEKAQILSSAGIPAAYFEPRYSCRDCQDTGFVDGKRCHCLTQRLIDLAYEASGIRDELEKKNFSTFKIGLFPRTVLDGRTMSPQKNMRKIAKAAFTYTEQFPDNQPHSLLFYGDPGTGKTFLCDCIAKKLLDQGFTVLYLTANALCSALDEFRFHRNPSMQEKAQLIHDQLGEVDLLIVDDLGTEFASQITMGDLFECFNQRILKSKATIISTNLKPEQLRTTYMDRLYSRFNGYYQFYEFYGPDLRTIK